ncbi:unannotated protein [freshwater metagenome]|uniref:Unannotated protein n=1 Tax=freshwater metagenome TaxID=449393 RepID=A0A6J6W0W7_9ZZZZ|nr:hypothetical protein [Actinomycetota bacterium]
MVRLTRALVGAMILFIGLMTIAPAQANSLVGTSPISGSSLVNAPSAVTITTQGVLIDGGNTVTVTDPKGLRVDDGTITVDGMSVIVGMQALKNSGIYKVSYSLLAENDAPLEGTFTFSFTAPAVISSPTAVATVSASAAPTASSGRGTSIFVLGLLFAAFFVLVFLILYARKLIRDH